MPDDIGIQELQARLSSHRRLVEQQEPMLASVPLERQSTNRLIIGGSWGSIGVLLLHSGDAPGAKDAFARAGRYEMELPDLPPYKGFKHDSFYATALNYAVLAGDVALETAVADKPFANDKSLTPAGAGLYRFVRACVRDHAGEAESAIEQLQGVPDDQARKQKFYPAMGLAAEGLWQRRADQLSEALAAILQQHRKYAMGRGHLAGGEGALLCVPATVLAIVAHRRGTPVHVSSQHRRATLRFRVRVLEPWYSRTDGPGFELEANVLPFQELLSA